MASYKKTRFKDEFSRSRFTFDINNSGESRKVFVQSKVDCISPVFILIFRVISMSYFLFGMFLSIINHQGKHHWIVYMTSLNYLLIVVYFIYGVVVSCYAVLFRKKYCKNAHGVVVQKKKSLIYTPKECIRLTVSSTAEDGRPQSPTQGSNGNTCKVDLIDNMYSVDAHAYNGEDNSRMIPFRDVTYQHARLYDNQLPKPLEAVTSPVTVKNELGLFFKLYWLCSCLAFNLTALTVVIYWVMMFRYQATNVSSIRWFLRLDRHAIVLVFMIMDHMISGIPIRILHFIYPSIVFLIYGLINAIYTILTKDFVYAMLNFNENTVTSTVYVVGASFIATPLMQLIIYWTIYRLRERLFSSY